MSRIEAKVSQFRMSARSCTSPRGSRGEQSCPWLQFWLVAPWTEMTADICKTQERVITLPPCAGCVTVRLTALSSLRRWDMHQICHAHQPGLGQWNSEAKNTGGCKMRTISFSCKFGNTLAAVMLGAGNLETSSFKQRSGNPPWDSSSWYPFSSPEDGNSPTTAITSYWIIPL